MSHNIFSKFDDINSEQNIDDNNNENQPVKYNYNNLSNNELNNLITYQLNNNIQMTDNISLDLDDNETVKIILLETLTHFNEKEEELRHLKIKYDLLINEILTISKLPGIPNSSDEKYDKLLQSIYNIIKFNST